MTELVRTVRSGSVGLDLVLGGGPRLLRRIAGSTSESATVLVRGGPGAGKSVLAADLAMRMGRAVGGDVLYVCVEILPSEVLAQRMGFDGFDPAKAIDLANPEARRVSGDGPTLLVGLTEMDMSPGEDERASVPDLGQMILNLFRMSVERGGAPSVIVVDSLSDGYGLGAKVDRPTVDGVCKLAVEQGWVLVLVEEAVDDRASPWSFAVDTVLSLDVTPAGRREVRVTKHRFGPCHPGPHRLLVEREGVRVIPCFDAYRNAVRDIALPSPATNRSLRLRVPVMGPVPDWNRFDVPDGEGRIVAVQTSVPTDMVTVEAMGAITQDGTAHPGSSVTLLLEEHAGSGREPVATLHRMIDGQEWLEHSLSRLAGATSLIAVRIGPTERALAHENGETLKSALRLLGAILAQQGIVVVFFGNGVWHLLSGERIDEQWSIAAPAGGLRRVVRTTSQNTIEFELR